MSTADWEAQYEEDLRTQTSSGPLQLTDEHRKLNRQLCALVRDLLPLDDDQKISDCDLLYRALIGKDFNLHSAEKIIRECVANRARERLNGILAEPEDEEVRPLVAWPYGHDREGLPMLWMHLDPTTGSSLLKSMPLKRLLRAQLRSMELTRYICRATGRDRFTFFLSFSNVSMSSASNTFFTYVRAVIKLQQDLYPEASRRMVILNASWVVMTLWRVIRSVVDRRITDKIRFLSDPPNLASLREFAEPDQVPLRYGGTGDPAVVTALQRAEEERLQRGATQPATPPSSPTDEHGDEHDDDHERALFSLCSSFHSSTAALGAAPRIVVASHGMFSEADVNDVELPLALDYDAAESPSKRQISSPASPALRPPRLAAEEQPGVAADWISVSFAVDADGSARGMCNGQTVGRICNNVVYACRADEGRADSLAASDGEPVQAILLAMQPLIKASVMLLCDAARCPRYLLRRCRRHVGITLYEIRNAAPITQHRWRRADITGVWVLVGTLVPTPCFGGGADAWTLHAAAMALRSSPARRPSLLRGLVGLPHCGSGSDVMEHLGRVMAERRGQTVSFSPEMHALEAAQLVALAHALNCFWDSDPRLSRGPRKGRAGGGSLSSSLTALDSSWSSPTHSPLSQKGNTPLHLRNF